MNADITTIETALLGGKNVSGALAALYRVRDRLPAPTLWEQFEQFPVGTIFQATPSHVTFVKTGDNAVVRVDDGYASGVVVEYYDDVKKVWSQWATLTETFVVVL